jgi:hypothetical protein
MVCGVAIMVCWQPSVHASPAPAGALGVSINWNPETSDPRERAIWLAYLVSRAAYLEQHKDLFTYGWHCYAAF